MEDEFVVIGIYQNIHEAHILRDRLEIEGVDAWITDENTILNNPFFSRKVGGAKLNVRIGDERKALDVLKGLEESNFN